MTQKQYNILDFFPSCILPECPEHATGDHQHIFPRQQEIIDSISSKYTYIQGGVGGGKTTAIACCMVWLALIVPENELVVSRYHYDDLFDSAWKEILRCIRRIVEKKIIVEPDYNKKVQGQYTEIVFDESHSELKAIQGKNWRRGLGSNKGAFWVDDALECDEQFFVGTEVSAGLLSRLRLPHVMYDKRVYEKDERPHGYLHGFVSSNPPPINHFLHTLFGRTAGTHTIGEDSVVWIQGQTTDNMAMGTSYAKGLIGVQRQMGHNPNTIKRVIFGESVPAYGGVPVFPQFDHAKHVAPLKFDPNTPIVRSVDFGFLHPAVTFSHVHRCKYGTFHFFTLSEIADCFNATVYELWDNYVIPHTKALYGEAKIVLNAGDRAGFRFSPSNKDKRGDMKILIHDYNLRFRYHYMERDASLQYMRALLNPRHACQCGMELILVSERCPALIGALEGGYRYSKGRDGKIGDKPVEDRYFADIACAWRYGAENFVKWGIPWEDQVALRQQQQQAAFARQRAAKAATAWGWMEATDEEIGAALVE